MPRSKLEAHEEILTVLYQKPLTLDSLAYKCKMDCLLLKQRLEFLLKNNLVEEAYINKKRLYQLTRRGVAIHKTLSITKRLEKLQTRVEVPIQTVPTISKDNQHGPLS
ncbi:MAG: winged helix-turn-helix domain-containing protein [Candidatus Bathyarchaeota archaeon]|nr:winged helix-turn-helix domain-containing protein [Candidatus Bathyarchaeota archaeon]